MSDDPLDTYVVQCSGGDLFAVSHDMTGAILPRASCAEGWILRGKCRLGEHASVPARVNYYRPCSARRPMAPVLEIEALDRRRGARLVTSLAPVSLDAGVRPGRRICLVRHFIQCVFNSLPTMLKPLSLVVSRYEHWLAND